MPTRPTTACLRKVCAPEIYLLALVCLWSGVFGGVLEKLLLLGDQVSLHAAMCRSLQDISCSFCWWACSAAASTSAHISLIGRYWLLADVGIMQAAALASVMQGAYALMGHAIALYMLS